MPLIKLQKRIATGVDFNSFFMTIHKEGNRIILSVLAILLFINVVYFNFIVHTKIADYLIPIASVGFFLFILQFFRNPKVTVPVNDNHVLAPADGKVVVIEKTFEDEYLKENRIQVSIFMSPVNVHVNRSPMAGKIKYFKYHKGKYLVAWHPKSSTENERTTLVLETEKGFVLLDRQIAGILARRIKFYKNEGDELKQGDEFGFIRFGSRLDVFLPLDAKIEVELNQNTKAGRTVLASLK